MGAGGFLISLLNMKSELEQIRIASGAFKTSYFSNRHISSMLLDVLY